MLKRNTITDYKKCKEPIKGDGKGNVNLEWCRNHYNHYKVLFVPEIKNLLNAS